MTRTAAALMPTLIEQIYDAVLDPATWPKFTDTLAQAFRGSSVLLLQDLRSAKAGVCEFARFDPRAIADYTAFYSRTNPWLPKIVDAPAGTLITGQALLDRATFEGTEFYADWLRPQRLHHMIGGVLLKDADVATNVSVIRPRAAKAFEAEEIALYRQLMSHLQRALLIHRHLADAALVQRALEERLRRLALGVVIVEASGRVVFANPVAERLLQAGDGVFVMQGRLRPRNPKLQGSFERMIREAALPPSGTEASDSGVLRLARKQGRPLGVLACPLRAEAARFGPAEQRALVFISDPDQRATPTAQMLAALYGMTPAEARLCAALLDGERVAEYAGRVGISVHTANSQLQQVFTKTETNRQAELVRLVLVETASGLLCRGPVTPRHSFSSTCTPDGLHRFNFS